MGVGGVEENSEAVMDAGEGGRFCQSKSPHPTPKPHDFSSFSAPVA